MLREPLFLLKPLDALWCSMGGGYQSHWPSWPNRREVEGGSFLRNVLLEGAPLPGLSECGVVELTRFLGHLILGRVSGERGPDGSSQ